MKCPFCAHPDTQVIETRTSEDHDSVRRRRRCTQCDRRFTTYERAEVILPAIVKKDGRRVEYDRRKIQASIALAVRKRDVSMLDIDAAVNRVEENILTGGQREIPSSRLGELVMGELRQLDKVAYIRFASVYLSFKDIDEFRKLADTVVDPATVALPAHPAAHVEAAQEQAQTGPISTQQPKDASS